MSDHQFEIAKRAYEIWERDGYPEGRALDHWLRAEAELSVDPPLENALQGKTTQKPKSQTPSPQRSKPKSATRKKS